MTAVAGDAREVVAGALDLGGSGIELVLVRADLTTSTGGADVGDVLPEEPEWGVGSVPPVSTSVPGSAQSGLPARRPHPGAQAADEATRVAREKSAPPSEKQAEREAKRAAIAEKRAGRAARTAERAAGARERERLAREDVAAPDADR